MNGSTATPEIDYDPVRSFGGELFHCDGCGNNYSATGTILYGCADYVPVICRPCGKRIGTIREDVGSRVVVG